MISRPTLIAAASLLALGLLTLGLYWRCLDATGGSSGPPLIVYVAAAARVPMEAIAQQYENETGRKVELRFGASEDILTKAGLFNPSAPADLLLPADESYLRIANERGLIAERVPIASMRAVALTAEGNPKSLAIYADLQREGVRVAVPNPAAAIGKLTREYLARTGRWDTLKPRVIDTGTVTEAANASKVGSVDAAIVWDAVAANYPDQTVLRMPELDGVTARVEVAVLKQSANPTAALHFARYLTAADRGLAHFRTAGFHILEPADTWAENPNLVLYSNAIPRPAVHETIADFEQREGVSVTRESNESLDKTPSAGRNQSFAVSFAVSKGTLYPRLAGRLLDAIKAADAKEHIARLGSGSGAKK